MVFKYLIDKYGKDNCSNVITFGRLQTKAVIKDISKALSIPFEEVNAFTKLLPSGPGADISITKILEDPQYNTMAFVKKYPEVFKHAKILEGSPRHVSQHPAGIAISPLPVWDVLPVYKGKPIELQDGSSITGHLSQFEKEAFEQVGLNSMGPSKKLGYMLELPKAA